MKKRLLAIVFAMLMLCTTLSFSILASINPNGDASNNETPDISWGDAEPEPDLPAEGDVDNNGMLNVNDALTLFRYIAKQPNVTINGTNGDVDGNGMLNVNDALTLFRYIAKQPNVTIVWGVLTPLA